MNTTIAALKALYTALGGSASDVANVTLIPDMIMKLFITKKGKREGMIVKAQSLIAFNIPSDTTLPNISVTGIKAKKMIAKI